MRISVLAVPGLFDSGLSTVLDVLATANALREEVAHPLADGNPALLTACFGRATASFRR
jgi:hypothetical protein